MWRRKNAPPRCRRGLGQDLRHLQTDAFTQLISAFASDSGSEKAGRSAVDVVWHCQMRIRMRERQMIRAMLNALFEKGTARRSAKTMGAIVTSPPMDAVS